MSRFVLFSDSASRGWCAESSQCITINVQADTDAIGITENPVAQRLASVQMRTDETTAMITPLSLSR